MTDPAAPTATRRLPVLVVVAVAVLLADVATKLWAVAVLSDRRPITVIPKVLELTETRNPGAAFSFAEGATIIFSLVAVGVIVAIIRIAPRLRSTGWALSLGLLLGGAAGNLLDRLLRAPAPLRGEVVDWIHLSHWPIFNLADSAICIGGAIAVVWSARGIGVDGVRLEGKARTAATTETSEADGLTDRAAQPGSGTADPGKGDPEGQPLATDRSAP